MQNNLADFSLLAYAFRSPEYSAHLKTIPEDFVVDEISNTELSGTGEHLWCWVEKQQQNTDWVAGKLAKWAQTSKKNIGYAGQKDRHALTCQWFSINLAGKQDPDIANFNVDGVRVIELKRHHRKLQRGDLKGNRFKITLRNFESILGKVDAFDLLQSNLETRLNQIKKYGFPNYFGEQRFGWQGNNLLEAEKLFIASADKDAFRKQKQRKNQNQRHKQGLYISAARSWMFNELLSHRVELQNWNQCIDGDLVKINSECKSLASKINERVYRLENLIDGVSKHELQPAGTLFGDAPLKTQGLAYELEKQVQLKYANWMQGLQNMRAQADCRALQVFPQNFNWQWTSTHQQNNNEAEKQQKLELVLDFALPAGSFATALLRELVKTVEPTKIY